jgi:hypothetical protein
VSGIALKEWAVVVRALLAGEQILDLRKGGLREDNRRFEVRSERFWLYPTTEHERADLLKPAYRRWLGDASTPGVDGAVHVAGWAEVAGVASITDESDLDSLASKVIWTREYAVSRLEWKQRQPLLVLALRAHRLVEPVRVPFREGYAGCSSWVDLDGLPADQRDLPSEPALTDESFAARLELVSNGLTGGFDPPPG